jgi:hypothetical protein
MKPCNKCKTYRKCNQAGECLAAKKEMDKKPAKK